jgi:hypothetical protein
MSRCPARSEQRMTRVLYSMVRTDLFWARTIASIPRGGIALAIGSATTRSPGVGVPALF